MKVVLWPATGAAIDFRLLQMHKRLARRSNCVAILRPFQGEKVTVGHFGRLTLPPDRDEFFPVLLETAQHGVGDLAVHFDMAFAGKGEVTG